MEVVEHVGNALLAHLDSHDLHDFREVRDVAHDLLLGKLDLGQTLVDVCLTSLDKFYIVLSHQGGRLSAPASPCSSTHTMHVVLRAFRNIEVDYYLDFRNVQASGSHIGRN